MVIRDVCPRCQSSKYKKNGHIHNGKQNHHCHDCGRQFVQCLEQYLIPDDRRALIERLLMERISLRGICRVMGVGLKWLLGFLVQCFEGLVNLLPVNMITGQEDTDFLRSRRLRCGGKAGDFPPGVESSAHLVAVRRGRKPMPPRPEVLGDGTIGREEPLGVTR
jgi:hypothetical protein